MKTIKIVLCAFWLFCSLPAISQTITYSEAFSSGAGYCPGSSQYDNWVAFRAQLDTTAFVFTGVTVKGSADAIGFTCSDPTLVAQMAGSLKDGVVGDWSGCGGTNWHVGVGCFSGVCGTAANAIEFTATGSNCICETPGYTLRPCIGSSNWGGVNTSTCGGSTQTMTVEFQYMPYCIPTYSASCSTGEFIDGVTFSDLSNTASGCNGNMNNYIYYSDLTASVGLGLSYPITILPSGLAQGFGVWIDFNGDDDFADTGEFVMSSPSSAAPVVDTIAIPVSATGGLTLMRIRSLPGAQPSIADSCSNLSNGETEDYNLLIKYMADVGVGRISAPFSDCGLSSTSTITVIVHNYGFMAQDTIPLVYEVNGGGPISDTLFASINAGDSVSFTFSTPADLSTEGFYTINSWSELSGDGGNGNDSIIGTQIEHFNSIKTYPFVYDIESEALCGTSCGNICTLAGQWENVSTDDIDWAVDNNGTGSTGTGPEIDNTTQSSTGKYLYTEASGCNFEEAILLSPCLDLNATSMPYLNFAYHMFGIAMGSLFVDVDTGGVLTNVFSISGQQQTDQMDPWIIADIDLSAFSGIVRIQIRGVTGNQFRSDIAIDDIMVYDKKPNDVGVVVLDAPVGGCDLSAAESVTITVENFGTLTQTSIPVAFSVDGGPASVETISTSIAPYDSVTYTFTATADLSTPGLHSIDVWTELVNDSAAYNDSLLASQVEHLITMSSFPLNYDIESEGLCVTSCSFTCNLSGLWTNSTEDDTDWIVDENGTPSNSTGPVVDNTTQLTSGNYLFLESNGCYNVEGILLSPCLDLDAIPNPYLNFAYHMFGSTMGDLYVEIDSSKSGNWVNLFTANGQQQTVQKSPWMIADIDLSAFSGITMLRIRGVIGSSYLSDMAIDDIVVYDKKPNDVGVIAIVKPSDGCDKSATETITVQVENFGTSTQTSIPVSVSVDGGAPITETISTSLAPYDTIAYTFTATADLSTTGLHTIDSWTELANDSATINDSLLAVSVDHLVFTGTFPINYDVESEGLCITNCTFSCNLSGPWANASDDGLDWTVDENGSFTTGTGPLVDNTTGLSTGNYLYTVANGCNLMEAVLMSQCMDFSGLSGPTLTFAYHMYGADMGELYVDFDTSGTWTNLLTISGEQHSSETDPWLVADIDLSVITGIGRLRIRGVTGPGALSEMAIDDLNIFERPLDDVGVTSIDSPPICGVLGSAENVTLSVRNFGQNTQDTIPVGYTINGGPSVFDTIYTALNTGDTVVYTFSVVENLSTPGAYTIDAWTDLTLDIDTTNDRINNHVASNLPVCCTPTYSFLCTSNDYIDGVLFQTIFNDSTGCSDILDNHTYYSTDTAWVTKGENYNITITPSIMSGQGFGVWIDFNQNGDFGDSSEFVFSSGSSNIPVSGTIYIPGSAIVGNTIMRIRSIKGMLPPENSHCDLRSRGETEDYNIVVEPTGSIDAALVNIIAPVTNCDLSDAELVTVEIQSFGGDTIFGLDVYYTLDGGTPVMETIGTSIPPPGLLIYTFATPLDLSAPGSHIIDAWTDATGDAKASNDTYSNYQISHLSLTTTFPITEDFDLKANCSTVCGNSCNISGQWSNYSNDDFDWTVNSGGTPTGGTGPLVDYTKGTIAGKYIYTQSSSSCISAEAILNGPCFVVDSMNDPYLSFYYHFYGISTGSLYVEADSGTGWMGIDTLIGQQQSVQSDPWRLREVDLSMFSGIIRLRLRALTGPASQSNMAVDDLRIFSKPKKDVGVTVMTAPVTGCLGNAELISIVVKNFGAQQQDTIPVAYSVNGASPVPDTIYSSLGPGDTMLFTFTTPADLSASGIYLISAWTYLAQDANESNDSVVQNSVENISTVAGFSADNVKICLGDLVTFTDESTNNPTSWSWQFGDSTTSISQDPNHLYSDTGTYTVTLMATNMCNTDTLVMTDYVQVVLPPVTPQCIPSVASPSSGVGAHKVTFNTILNSTGAINTGYVDYSCNQFTNVLSGSKHTLSVITGSTWNENLRAWIDFNNDSSFNDLDELVLISDNTYQFHDTTFIIPQNVVLDTMLRMRIASDFSSANPPGSCDTLTYGQIEDYGVKISFLPLLPVADFTFDIPYGCNGIVNFEDFSEFFPFDWFWDFGDGNTSTGSSQVTHTYANPGYYNVTLVSTNSFGSDTTYQTISLDTVTADFLVTEDTIEVGEMTTFINTSAGADTYSWDFGDLVFATTANASHSYSATGLYAVWLYSTNSVTGCTDSKNFIITVVPAVIPGVDNKVTQQWVNISPNPTSGMVFIDFIGYNTTMKVAVFNIIGELVFEKEMTVYNATQQLIDLSGYGKGVYTIKMSEINAPEAEVNNPIIRKIILE